MRDALYLVSKGVPYDIAMKMKPARRMAHIVIFSGFDGKKWNWDAGRWEEDK